MDNKTILQIYNEFLKPEIFIFLLATAGIGWATAIQLSKEVTDLKRRLGRD